MSDPWKFMQINKKSDSKEPQIQKNLVFTLNTEQYD